MIQYDEHIFQMGWFNHQLAMHQIGNSVLVEKLFRGAKIRNQAAADTVDGRNPANQLIHIY